MGFGCLGWIINLLLCSFIIIIILLSRQKGPNFPIFSFLCSLIVQRGSAVALGIAISTMATKIFKYFSQMFVVKEREMEIGYPTDVKHVAHIGWDGPSDSAPTWMNEFKNGPDFSTSSLGSRNGSDRMVSSNPMAYSPWSSQDFEQSMGRQQSSDMFRDLPPNGLPNVPKKPKRKRVKSSSPSTTRSSRSSSKSKTPSYAQMEPSHNLLI